MSALFCPGNKDEGRKTVEIPDVPLTQRVSLFGDTANS
jgi:hypothetical protein